MKGMKRALALVLSAAVVVTSVQMNGNITSYAAAPEAGTETGDAAPRESASLITWEADNFGDGYTVDGNMLQSVEEFDSAQQYVDEIYMPDFRYRASFDAEALAALWTEEDGPQAGDIDFDSMDFSYQWQEMGEDGNYKNILWETNNSYEVYEYITNASPETKYRCVATLESINGIDLPAGEGIEPVQVIYEKVYRYVGPTEEKINDGTFFLTDYFYFEDESFPNAPQTLYYASTGSSQRPQSSSFNFGVEDYNGKVSYQWNAYAVRAEGEQEAAKAEVYTASMANSVSNRSLPFRYNFMIGEESVTRQVDYYELSVDFYYGSQKLATRKVRYDVRVNAIRVNTPAENDFIARKGETKQLSVSAQRVSSQIGNLTYRWYKIVGTGQPQLMEGFDDSNIAYVKVDDYNTKYKCVVSADRLEEAFPDIVLQEMSCTFTPSESAGYRLKTIDEHPEAVFGQPAELSIKAAVDTGYTLEYKWEKASYQENSDTIIHTPIAGQTSDTYRIAATTAGDFNTVWDDNLDNGDGASYTHRLTVTVKRGTEKIGGEAYYYFRLRQITEDPYTITCNFYDGEEMTIEKGKDVELTCKTESTAYTLEKTWYKIQEVEYVAKKDANGDYVYKADGTVDYELADSSVTVPAAADKTSEYTYDEDYDYKNGTYIDTRKMVTYYTKLAATDNTNTTLKLPGTNADNRGTYRVEVKITDKADADDTWTDYRSVTLVYDTDLKAYAKTTTITSSVGGTATLEVVASNKNVTLYPVKYQWQKLNAAGKYEDIQGAVSATYAKSSLKDEDFGQYRVQVTDLSGAEKYVTFYLNSEAQKAPVFHTPTNSYYKKSIGESAQMEVAADIPGSVKVEYIWYRTETYIKNYIPMYGYYWDEDEIYEDTDWQILNETAAKYTAQISSDEDFCTYKCVARYRVNGFYNEQTFYYHVENAANDIVLERITPEIQYKQIGDSASYGVRYKTVSSAIKESDVKYQWYDTDGEEISGATGATYTVAKIEAKDIGTISCRVTYSDTNLSKWIDFTTRIYSEVKAGYGDDIISKVGADVHLKAEVQNPKNRPLTYQWGYSRYSWGDSDKIYGATNAEYTIPRIGENEFGLYSCSIYDGDLLVATYRVWVEKETVQKLGIELNDYDSEVSVITGKPVSLKVEAKSLDNLKLSYQWYYCDHEDDDYDYDDDDDYYVIHNYKAIGGATASTYSIPYAIPSMAGTYRCVITDEGGQSVRAEIDLNVDSGLTVDSGSKYEWDTIGYQTTIGGSVTLKANAKAGEGYGVFYQWYKLDYDDDDEGNVIYNATSSELKLTNIKMEDIGYYSCRVTDAQGNVKYLRYQVYINTGLVVEPSIANPRQAANGSVKMFVEATANKGEKITYQWRKDGEVIPNAVSSSYQIPKITKDVLGDYSCTVSTSGESYTYYYTVATMYEYTQSREYAEQGNSFTMNGSMVNAATDAAYTYQWYAQDGVTGALMKTDCKTAAYKGTAPVVKMGSSLKGYVPLRYICEVYRDGELVHTYNFTLNVFPKLTYANSVLPQTSHPFDKRIDVKAYKVANAKNIKITLDAKSEWVTVIDAAGHAHYMSGTQDKVLTLDGNSAIFIAVNGNATGYGYKVASIVDASPAPAKPPVVTKPVPAKGKTYKVGGLSYKVTKSAAKSGTVSVTGAAKKTVTSVTIPATVKINGYTFKVTAVGAKAFSGYKKLKKVTVGTNVTAIDKEAFKSCSALGTITIKTTKLKSVGKNALKGIKASASVKVPSKKLKAYKKLFKNKGQGKKVKIKK